MSDLPVRGDAPLPSFLSAALKTTRGTPTGPQRPLHPVFLLKLLREEEVEHRPQTREGQGHPEGQGQLLPPEPESCDAVLNDWGGQTDTQLSSDTSSTRHPERVRVSLVRDPFPDPNSSRPVSITGSK